jgi:hypothetical protein
MKFGLYIGPESDIYYFNGTRVPVPGHDGYYTTTVKKKQNLSHSWRIARHNDRRYVTGIISDHEEHIVPCGLHEGKSFGDSESCILDIEQRMYEMYKHKITDDVSLKKALNHIIAFINDYDHLKKYFKNKKQKKYSDFIKLLMVYQKCVELWLCLHTVYKGYNHRIHKIDHVHKKIMSLFNKYIYSVSDVSITDMNKLYDIMKKLSMNFIVEVANSDDMFYKILYLEDAEIFKSLEEIMIENNHHLPDHVPRYIIRYVYTINDIFKFKTDHVDLGDQKENGLIKLEKMIFLQHSMINKIKKDSNHREEIVSDFINDIRTLKRKRIRSE